MNDTINPKLLESYFNGTCSEEEALQVEQWMGMKKRGDEDLVYLNVIFDKIERRDDRMADRAYKHCTQLLQFPEADEKESAWKKAAPHLLWGLAAILSVILALQIRPVSTPAEPEPAAIAEPVRFCEIYAERGHSKTIVLPDSSTVILKSGSHIIFPESFSGDTRQVWLTGECYASISRDEEHPFILSTALTDIRVLGTEFNVKSFPEDSEAEVALIKGSVILDKRVGEGTTQTVSMVSGNVVKIDRNNGDIRLSDFDVNPYSAEENKENVFVFLDQRLRDIVSELSRRMDVDIILGDNNIGERRFYSYFVNGESLDDILNTFNADRSMNIIKEGRTIKITSKAIL